MALEKKVPKSYYLFLKDLREGLWLTLKYFFTKPFTIQYPEEKREVSEKFRGYHFLESKPDVDEVKCVGCGLCPEICPTKCIEVITRSTPEGDREVVEYNLDLVRCCFCGFCEEVCPVGAIHMSGKYNWASYERGETTILKKEFLKNNLDSARIGRRK